MSITSQPRNNAGKKIQLAEIAQLAGVSASTVSRVLNNKAQNISSEVQQRVMAAVSELSPNQPLVRRNIEHVSLFTSWVIDRANESFYTGILIGIEAECQRQGIHFSYTHLTSESESIEFILDKVSQNRIDGIIFSATDNQRLLEEVLSYQIPAVLINANFFDLPFNSYLPDNFGGTRLAMNHLLGQGHRRILHVSDLRRNTIRQRYMAYRNSLDEAEIEYDPRLVLKVADLNAHDGYEEMRKFLANKPPEFSAIFCANDFIAIGVMKALREANLRVPEDISIVGFDDIPFTEFTDPALTTVHVPREALGAKALQGLLDRVSNPNQVPFNLELGCKLVVRDSVAPLSKELNPAATKFNSNV